MWAMKSSVTTASATSVTSILCLAIRESSRSNGPVKFSSRTWNTGRSQTVSAAWGSAVATAETGPGAAVDGSAGLAGRSGDVATVDELASQLAVVVGALVVRGEGS